MGRSLPIARTMRDQKNAPGRRPVPTRTTAPACRVQLHRARNVNTANAELEEIDPLSRHVPEVLMARLPFTTV